MAIPVVGIMLNHPELFLFDPKPLLAYVQFPLLQFISYQIVFFFQIQTARHFIPKPFFSINTLK
jgi:hypothetical protein